MLRSAWELKKAGRTGWLRCLGSFGSHQGIPYAVNQDETKCLASGFAMRNRPWREKVMMLGYAHPKVYPNAVHNSRKHCC